jgi:hypothetical protein
VLYVSTSYLMGSTSLHSSPVGVFMTTDSAQKWSSLAENRQVAMVNLIPVSGHAGAVYALTEASRTPLALGNASEVAAAMAAARQDVQQAAAQSGAAQEAGLSLGEMAAWIVAGLAALALLFALAMDLREQDRKRAADGPLAHAPVRYDR